VALAPASDAQRASAGLCLQIQDPAALRTLLASASMQASKVRGFRRLSNEYLKRR